MQNPRTRSYISPWSSSGDIEAITMVDVVTERFKERVMAGELISNGMSRHSYHGTGRAPGVFRQQCWYNGRFIVNIAYNVAATRFCHPSSDTWKEATWFSQITPLIPPGWDWDEDADAIMTALSADLSTDGTQSLVTLAESVKTGRMLAKAGKFLLRPLSDAQKILRFSRAAYRNPAKAKKIFDLASNLWMEARYGWRPFIYDIIGHAEAIMSPRRCERRTVRKSKIYPESTQVWDNILYAGSSGLGNLIKTNEITVSAKLRCGQTADYRSSVDLTALRFGAYDLVGTAWELVPLSFVYDWFINLGDMARSLQAYALIDERVGFATMEITGGYTSRILVDGKTYVPSAKGYWRWLLPPTELVCRETFTKKVRTVPTSFLPSLDFKLNLDWAKVTDLAVILKQRTRYR